MVTASRTMGVSTSEVVSSLPLWPPASKPSATTASQPAAAALRAKWLLLTTCTTFIPLDCKVDVYKAGLPALVNTMGTFSRMIISSKAGTSGYMSGIFTPNGCDVADRHLRICSSNTAGYILPAPINPNPPALLTAEANCHPLAQTIPPCIIGYRILNKRTTRLSANVSIYLQDKCY